MRRLALLPALLAFPASAWAVEADGARLAAAVDESLTRVTKVEVTSVRCPARVDVVKGGRVTCRVVFASGDRTPATVTFTGADGDFTVKPRDFLMRNFEDQVERRLADGGAVAQVRCPREARRIRAGDRFTCSAEASSGDTATVRARQTGRGYATYAIR